jgi:superoxide dismutase, Fe-Mn family
MRLTEIKKPKDKLTLVELPYALDALEPVMEREVVEFHYGVLSKGYVDRYNSGEGDPEFNRAGALLHNTWWPQFRPPSNKLPTGKIKAFIEKHYGDFANFKEKLTEQALSIQGSGWTYLAQDGKIKIIPNHQWHEDIVLLLDEWEHATTPFTVRKDYMKTVWKIIDWDVISARLKN